MLKRKIDQDLIVWKKKRNHKPLIVYGARQVGKTTSIEQFGKANYTSFVSVNFISNPEYKTAFSSYDPESIIRNLSLMNPSFRFIENETLILFDEIQSFMDATTSLKFFSQQGKYDVICSGSELGIKNNTISSVAVGFKEEYLMHTMDFEEYLWAKGYDSNLPKEIVTAMVNKAPLDATLLNTMNRLFLEYSLIGGYPDVVNTFIQSNQYTDILSMQRNILKDYHDDISKYLDGMDIARTNHVFDSIAPQLAKDNHKFQFTKLGHGARFSSYYGCVDWLKNAGIVLVVNNIPTLELPLKGTEDVEIFRLYFSDTSLLIASLDNESQADLINNKNLGVYKGAVYENIVASALDKQKFDLFFHRSKDSTIELDFIIRFKEEIIPIEVKAKHGRQLSLKTVLKNMNILNYGFKFGMNNIGEKDNIISFPLFCISFLSDYLNQLR